jgi:hypothetical protein
VCVSCLPHHRTCQVSPSVNRHSSGPAACGGLTAFGGILIANRALKGHPLTYVSEWFYGSLMPSLREPDASGKTRGSAKGTAPLVPRHLRLCAALVAAVLLVAPAVIALDGGDNPACSSSRLNRSAATSTAKTKSTLSHDAIAASSSGDRGQSVSQIVARASALDETTFDSPSRPPETRRGPPALLRSRTDTPSPTRR